MKIRLHFAPGAAVLDAGCGSGRDSLRFMQAYSATLQRRGQKHWPGTDLYLDLNRVKFKYKYQKRIQGKR